MSVLLHNRRDLVIRGPKFKKTSLHSLHYLLRQDLAKWGPVVRSTGFKAEA